MKKSNLINQFPMPRRVSSDPNHDAAVMAFINRFML
jgi:hypothetical protein